MALEEIKGLEGKRDVARTSGCRWDRRLEKAQSIVEGKRTVEGT
jgi:hypothetical protein